MTRRLKAETSKPFLSGSAAPLIALDGDPAGVMGVFLDVTERRRAHEALRATETLARRVLDNSPDCVKLLDLEGRVRFINEPGQRLLGICDITPFIGQPWVDFWRDPDHRAAAQTAIARALAGDTTQFEGHFTTLDGRSTWWEVAVSAIPDESGHPFQILALSREITARREASLQREQLMSELTRSNQELSQFSHMVAHDLQAPVRTIHSFVELLGQKHGKDGDENIRRMMLDAAERMQTLIRSLLTFAEVGQGELRRVLIDTGALLQTVVQSMRASIDESVATVQSGDLPRVEADRPMLEQLLQNLISNAIKYKRSTVPPTIRITGERVEGGWKFAVADNGEGIEGKYLE
jgi:PAS domain S-box-containing protein